MPVSTNAGGGAAPSVRSPLLAGVGEALNGLMSDGDDHNAVSNEDRRGGFNVVKVGTPSQIFMFKKLFIQGPKKWFAAKEGPRQEQAIFSGTVL